MSGDNDARVPSELWKNQGDPPKLQDVLGRVGGLLKDLGYEKSLAALEKEGKKKGVSLEGQTSADGKELLRIWAEANTAKQVAKSDDSSDSSSSEESDGSESEADIGASPEESDSSEDSSSSSDSDSSSDSSSDSDSPAKAGQKRKRASSSSDSSSSSSSESDSDSSSSSDSSSEDERPAKKAKLSKKGKSDSSSSDSSSDSSSSDSDAAKTKGKGKKKSVSSAASASSSSDSSDSSSSEEEESSSSAKKPSSPSPAPRPKKSKSTKKKAEGLASLAVPTDSKPKKTSSTSSSATLDAENSNDNSNDNDPEASNTSMHPDRANLLAPQSATTNTQQTANGKKQAIPFSRIPKDQQVDSRFGSNKYVSYDYADRAYKDLSVTKGKGFTKEKNKKKRGTSSKGKSAEQRDWERQARYDLSLSPEGGRMSSVDDFPDLDNPLGLKEDTFAFMSGCGFDSMGGGFGF